MGAPFLTRNTSTEQGCVTGTGVSGGAETFDWGGGDDERVEMGERMEKRMMAMREEQAKVEPEVEEPPPYEELEPQPQPVAGTYEEGDNLFHDSLNPCTVLSVHADPAGGPEYYTVSMADTGGERQTLASRLSRSQRDFRDGDVCTMERHEAPVVVLGYEEGVYVIGVFEGGEQSVDRCEPFELKMYMSKEQQEGGGTEENPDEKPMDDYDGNDEYPVDDYPVDDEYPGDDSYPVEDEYPVDPYPTDEPSDEPYANSKPPAPVAINAPLPKSKVKPAFKPRAKTTTKRHAPVAKSRAKKRKIEEVEGKNGDDVTDFLSEIEGL